MEMVGSRDSNPESTAFLPSKSAATLSSTRRGVAARKRYECTLPLLPHIGGRWLSFLYDPLHGPVGLPFAQGGRAAYSRRSPASGTFTAIYEQRDVRTPERLEPVHRCILRYAQRPLKALSFFCSDVSPGSLTTGGTGESAM